MHLLFVLYLLRYPAQKSAEIELVGGKKYYLEAILVEGGGSNHISVGAYLPDGKSILPITAQYLSASTD